MMMRDRVVASFHRNGGNVRATARELGVERSTVRYHLKKAGASFDRPVAGGKMHAEQAEEYRAISKGAVRRYILTSAQNNTKVNRAVWDNLQAIANFYNATFLCASYTYNKNAYGKLAVKPGTLAPSGDELWFDSLVKPYLEASDRNIELAPGLVWCGRMNTLPTSPNPLSGFETYTGRKSGIFPHAKIAMASIASGKTEATKFNYTTGTVTQINYIQKAAGLKAEHHHNYGGLIVEVDDLGRWWVRQLNAAADGTIHDLDIVAQAGQVRVETVVEAITWGDIHHAQIDPVMEDICFGDGGVLDVLRPKYQFLHDVLDFRARNHHDLKNPHAMFKLWLNGRDSVEDEIGAAANFLGKAHRDWCETLVVDSNHDNALTRWLREVDWRTDMQNAEFYLEAQLEILRSIRTGEDFHTVEWAMQRAGCPAQTRFLRQDESYVICRDSDGGIECGMHGDLGPNGARGNPRNLSKMGRRANTGHTHSAGILDGMYIAGTLSKLDMGYNRGPSSWSQSIILTYGTGNRAIVTIWDGKWRA